MRAARRRRAATSTSYSQTITAAALTITANSTSKTYGDTVTFDGSEFSTTGLVNGDTVNSVSLSSLGADPTAIVAGSPYAITASNALGSGLDNYTITYVPGQLTVNTAALTITADSTSKTYGDTVTFDGTEFSTTGPGQRRHGRLRLTLTSLGAAPTAAVAGSPYAHHRQRCRRLRAGQLHDHLRPRPAHGQHRRADHHGRQHQQDLRRHGHLRRHRVLHQRAGQLRLGQLRHPVQPRRRPDGLVAGSPYAITASDAVGSGLGNYTITYVPGQLTVNTAALTITADSTSKTYGDTVTFDGTEFTTIGLVNGDTVDSVTLSSRGAADGRRGRLTLRHHRQ